jgi:hypothetical protein
MRVTTAVAAPMLLLGGVIAGAQGVAPRALGPVVAESPLRFGRIAHLRPLSNGEVLVHDQLRMQVLRLSESLTDAVAVVDSTSGDTTSYNGSSTMVLPYWSDSTVIYQPASNAFLVLDPRGRYARFAPHVPRGGARGRGSLPRGPIVPPTAFSLAFGLIGVLDHSPTSSLRLPDATLANAFGSRSRPVWADSSLIVQVEMGVPEVGLIGRVANGRSITGTLTAAGLSGTASYPSFVPFRDAFAVISDGSVAMFRTRDSRIDWFNTDGSRRATSSLAYPQITLTAADRRRIADSVTAAKQAAYLKALERWLMDSAATSGALVVRRPVPPMPVSVEEVLDRLPVNARLLADAENRLWIRLASMDESPTAERVYDVVARDGGVIDRVRVPAGQEIVGFAPGFAFVTARAGDALVLRKVRLR